MQRVPCVGRCEQAPVAVVGTNPVKQATVEKVVDEVEADNTLDSAPESAIRYDEYVKNGGYELYQKPLKMRTK